MHAAHVMFPVLNMPSCYRSRAQNVLNTCLLEDKVHASLQLHLKWSKLTVKPDLMTSQGFTFHRRVFFDEHMVKNVIFIN